MKRVIIAAFLLFACACCSPRSDSRPTPFECTDAAEELKTRLENINNKAGDISWDAGQVEVAPLHEARDLATEIGEAAEDIRQEEAHAKDPLEVLKKCIR